MVTLPVLLAASLWGTVPPEGIVPTTDRYILWYSEPVYWWKTDGAPARDGERFATEDRRARKATRVLYRRPETMSLRLENRLGRIGRPR